MKKVLLLLALLLATLSAQAWPFETPRDVQDTLTVYDGEATSSYVPVFGFYADAYTKCQMIMPASELSDLIDGTISKLTWYLASPAAAAWGGNFQIYISEVSQATCPSVGFLDISGATLVYEGPLDGTGATMEIVFTQGYTYGGGNLLISVYETETGSWKAATFSGTTVTGASTSGYSYSGFEDVIATQRNFLPKTTFTYTPAACHKPKHLAASGITANSATITWEAGGNETSWGVEYKKAADEEWISEGTVTEKTITLDALDNGVEYDVRVKGICDDGESLWVQISFATPLCDETDMGEVEYTLTNIFGGGWNGGKLQVCIAGTDIVVQELTMVDDPETLDDKEITGTFKLCYDIDYDLVWVGGSYDRECGFVLTSPDGEIIAENQGTTDLSNLFPGVLTTFQIHREARPRPTNVTASNITSNSATITWEAGGDETSWGVEYKKATDEEWTSEGTVTEKTITLDALDNGVEYDVRVKGIYADGESKWAQISFATPLCDETDMGEVEYTLTDTYGDGWNGGKLQVCIAGTGIMVQELTMVYVPNTHDDKEITGTFKLCYGIDYDLVWVEGSYDYECGFVLTSPDGEIIAEFHGNGSSGSPTPGVLTTFQIHMEACPRPTDVTASNISYNSATITWEAGGDETSWRVEYKKAVDEEWISAGTVTEKTITLNALNNGVEYDVRVRGICADGWSRWTRMSFSTLAYEETDMTLTPYDVYTPNNVQTDSAENYRKLFDKDRSTKWCVDNSTGSWETIWVDFKSDVPFTPTGYTMTTGNDTQYWSGRNPKKWKIYAKAKESDSWTTIVDVTDGATAGLGSDDTTDYSFTIDGVNTGYQYFRFEVSEVCGRGGWQNNHYVFQLAELALNGVQVDPVDTLPFVPTPSLMSYPIHWYQLKINDKYVYYSGNMVSLTSTESTDDTYLWCFVELAPDSIVIYNKSEKQYMSYGVDLTLSPTASAINFVEPENKTGFYIYYYDGSTKYYHLEQPGYDILGESSQVAMAQLFNVTEVLVEEDHGEIKEAMLIPITAYTPNNANGNENEDYRKLFDKDKTTKWCVDNSTGSWETIWADFKCNVPFTPTGYTMTTGADTPNWPGRNPKKWKIYAKATLSDEWTTIVDVADGEAAGLGLDGTTDYNFTIDGLSQKYRYFRFEVSEVCGKGGWQNDHYVFQLAELLMYGYTSNAAVTGDVNGDNDVNVMDITALIDIIMNDGDNPQADVNGDGQINVMDITALIDIIMNS